MTPPPLDAPEWKDIGNGLKIWDVIEGTGRPAPPGGRVKVHYIGWLTDGTKFDSSLDRGQPIEFPLTGVIRGWQDGIPGMKPGGVRRLLIPPALGYGMRGAPGAIPPNATLVFEVELLDAR
jgi:FKBP-type peptidyl-prolyl cis-trans isomerase